jgi:hypothetical protein
MKTAIAICLASLALLAAGEPAGKGQPDPDVPVFDAASCGIAIDRKSLSEAERRLLRIQVPEIDFRQANLFDMLDFLDACIARFGRGPELNDKTRVRIVWDSDLERPLGPDDPFDMEAPPPKEPFEPYLPPPYRRIPILYSLKMIVEGSGVRYSVSNLTITVEQKMKTANNTPEDIRR